MPGRVALAEQQPGASLNVVATIAPLHSLVAALMTDIGEPHFLLAKAASAHHYSLRPSDAKHLANADLIVQIGGLESFLQKSISTIADSATVLSLAQTDGVTQLHARGFQHHGDSDHDSQHSGDGIDPHLWLDPLNAIAWVEKLATELSALDPDNTTLYASNSAALTVRLESLHDGLQNTFANLTNQRFIALHDAFQYLEHRYGLQTRGVMLDSSEQRVGVASLRRLAKLRQSEQINCLVTDPGSSRSVLNSFAGAADITSVELDILGNTLEPGPDLYFELMRTLSEKLAQCLSS